MATNEETNAAGTDTRPPMLVENDYESWKIRFKGTIRGYTKWKLICMFQPSNYQAPGLFQSKTHATVHECKEPKRKTDSQYFKDKALLMEAKEKGDVLDAEAEAFLADVECTAPYDQPQLSQEMHQEEHLDSDAETEIDDITLPYHQKKINCILQSEKDKSFYLSIKDLADSYLDEIVCLKTANKVARDMLQRFNMPTQTIPMLSKKPKKATNDLHKDILGTRNPGLGYMAKRAQPVLYDADTLLHPTHHPVSIWDSEEVLVHQVVSMKKMNEKPGHVRPANDFYAKLNALMFVPQKELSGDQVYWLSANEIASQASKPTTPATPFVHKSRPPSQVLASLQKVNAVFHQFEEKDICSIVLASVSVVPPSSNCLCEDLRSACDREHTKVLKLEAEVLKQQKMVIEYEKRNSHLQKTHVSLQLKFQNYKQCIDTSSASNAIFEINKLRQQLQGKDDTIRNLDAQINIMKVLNVGSTEGSCDQQALETDRIQLKDTITSLRIQLDGLKVENVSLKRRYDELSKANTHSRTAYTEKLSALTSENTKLKALVHGKTSSGPSTSEKPKVLASGMYTKSSKYIPPPKRANWVKPTPLPKKKQVTFQEPPRTSNRPTQKPPVQQNKKPNVPVNLSTRTKPATESRKPMPKSHTRNHHILPNKSVNARRAAYHNRKLNVVDHNQFVIRSLKSVNTKTPQAKHSVNHTKQVWKATRNHNVNTTKTAWRPTRKVVGSVKPQWKPTGRHFALYDTCPLTRIMEPIVEPLELTPSVSSSSKVSMISRFTDCKLSDRKAGSKGLSDGTELLRKLLVTMPSFAKAPLSLWAESVSRDVIPAIDPVHYAPRSKTLSVQPVQGLNRTSTNDFCDQHTELELTALQLEQPSCTNANGSPSTTVISEGAPAVTESLLPHQIPLPDTSDSDDETLFDHVDSNVFDTYNAPETCVHARPGHSMLLFVCVARYQLSLLKSPYCFKADLTIPKRNHSHGTWYPKDSGFETKSFCNADYADVMTHGEYFWHAVLKSSERSQLRDMDLRSKQNSRCNSDNHKGFASMLK
ncbi:hypothetical protein Tco_0533104 [Tanacetum coccineum]